MLKKIKMLPKEKKEKTVRVVVKIPIYMIKEIDEYGYEILMLVEESLGIKKSKLYSPGRPGNILDV
jgi:hypothetical protein